MSQPGPCPFCGEAGEVRVVEDPYPEVGRSVDLHRVWCKACGAMGPASRSEGFSTPGFDSTQQAIDKWDWLSRNKETRMTSVLQDWVMELPLRAQGTLLTGIRGCDLAPKDPRTINTEYG